VDFGSVKTLKRNLLIELAAIFARLLTRNGNRVGAILYGGGVEGVIPAQTGRTQVLFLIDTLLEKPKLNRSPPTDLSVLLKAGLRFLRRRSLVFIISDFIIRPGWDRPLSMLALRHEVIAIRLFDPLEKKLPDIGPVFMEDAETGERLFLDTHDRGFRK